MNHINTAFRIGSMQLPVLSLARLFLPLSFSLFLCRSVNIRLSGSSPPGGRPDRFTRRCVPVASSRRNFNTDQKDSRVGLLHLRKRSPSPFNGKKTAFSTTVQCNSRLQLHRTVSLSPALFPVNRTYRFSYIEAYVV